MRHIFTIILLPGFFVPATAIGADSTEAGLKEAEVSVRELKISDDFESKSDRVLLTNRSRLEVREEIDFHKMSEEILQARFAGFEESPFIPTSKLVFSNGQTFYFSNIFLSPPDKYDLVLMFAMNKTGKFVPRLLYKSKSDGGWRVSPETSLVPPRNMPFSKGIDAHYTQETKPVEELIKYLEQLEEKKYSYSFTKEKFTAIDLYLRCCFLELRGDKDNDERFDFKLKTVVPNTAKGTYTYDEEITIFKPEVLREFQSLPPGTGFKTINFADLDGEAKAKAEAHNARTAKSFYDQMRSLAYPEGFVPHFSRPPLRTYRSSHTLLGPITIEIYGAVLLGREIEWHMAYDQNNRIWIDRINFSEKNINSYGVLSIVIDSGLLTNKPIEHSHQVDLLFKRKEGVQFSERIKKVFERYHDMTPLLNILKPIAEFREALNRRSTQDLD